MNADAEKIVETFEAAAAAIRQHPGLDFKAAVRRTLGTAEWKHSDERLAAAQTKRERRMARNRLQRREAL